MKYSVEDVATAQKMMRYFVPKGSTVYCVLRGVSRSGMQRRIDLYAIVDKGQNSHVPRLQYLSVWAAVLLGMPRQNNGLRVNGCGMDMGFHVVESLAAALYGRDPKTGIGAGLRSEWI